MTMNRCASMLFVLLAAGGSLTACGRKDEAAPAVVTAPTPAVAASGPLPETAAALATPGTAPAANASPPSTMTRDQESKAMPLPGQANDHSTPKPAKPKGG